MIIDDHRCKVWSMVNYLNFNWLNPIACCWFNPFQCVMCISLLDPLSSHISSIHPEFHGISWHDHIFLHPYFCFILCRDFEASPSGGILIAAAQRHGQRPGAADGRVAGLGAGAARPRAGPGAAGALGCAGERWDGVQECAKDGKKGCLTWEVLWRIYSDTGICN